MFCDSKFVVCLDDVASFVQEAAKTAEIAIGMRNEFFMAIEFRVIT